MIRVRIIQVDMLIVLVEADIFPFYRQIVRIVIWRSWNVIEVHINRIRTVLLLQIEAVGSRFFQKYLQIFRVVTSRVGNDIKVYINKPDN